MRRRLLRRDRLATGSRRPSHRMGARQETLDRSRHLRPITKQHLGGALKPLSKTAIKEAARRIGLWSAGKLVLDSPDELNLVFDVAVFDTRTGQSRALDRYARAHRPVVGRQARLGQP